HIKPMLEKYKELDQRIKVIYREENGHISEATNSALSIATGDFIGFMDNDDELAPQALYEVVKALNTDPTIDFLYTDEDKITENGRRFNAFYKSDWNPELILNHNYITHFVVVKRDLLEKVGGLNSAYNGAQDYDFVLRATEQAMKIKHIPGMMYHWRAIESSTALNPESKGYAYVAGQKAVQAATERRGLKAQVEIAEFYGSYKINYLYDHVPMVSLIITNDTENM
ncbi:glycosyltransferase, partial [Enterococcus faecalis]|nr:glycosyltransferase [Enterococcus faecalis]